MRAERSTEAEFDLGITFAQVVARRGEIAQQMNARRKKIWDEQNAFRASFNASSASLIDRRLGEFEKSGFDDRVIAAIGDLCDHSEQVVVRGRVSTAVRDQKDRDDRFVRARLARVLVHPCIISVESRSAR